MPEMANRVDPRERDVLYEVDPSPKRPLRVRPVPARQNPKSPACVSPWSEEAWYSRRERQKAQKKSKMLRCLVSKDCKVWGETWWGGGGGGSSPPVQRVLMPAWAWALMSCQPTLEQVPKTNKPLRLLTAAAQGQTSEVVPLDLPACSIKQNPPKITGTALACGTGQEWQESHVLSGAKPERLGLSCHHTSPP